ncbi:DNA polymerase alpha catalytic subunit [Glugoides intestinalis]
MLFHVFNIDQKSDTEVYLYGKPVDTLLPIQTIRVTNVISAIYFLPTLGAESFLIEEIKAYCTGLLNIEKVKRQNIFHNSFKRSLDILRIKFTKKMNFNDFDSEHCEMMLTEFQNPVENLIISKGIMGPGILDLENVSRNTVEYDNVKFVKNAKFPNLQIASIAFETTGGYISKIVYYNKEKNSFTKAELSSLKIEKNPQTHQLEQDLLSEPELFNDRTENLKKDTRKFHDQKDLLSFLNEEIKKDAPDAILCHNLHIKSKVHLRERIFCDIFAFATGTVKGRDYSIQELCTMYRINKQRGLEGDALALVHIADSMNALPLAKEMAEISGYILNRCLGNCRAERIEYTLLHELYAKNYIFPPTTTKPNVKYAGGLVLDPVQGFYEDAILLLDFNSLYPSIIQEFNVCFSTVGSSGFYISEQNTEDILHNASILSSIAEQGEESFLPKILRSLVKRRRVVKDLLKNTKNAEELVILDIRQKALKLTANSIYGCLGFQNSRFCNFEMAAFITAKGRELLNETKIIAEEMNMKVIYGDTDSIMIHTKYPGSKEYYQQAVESARALVNKINGKYKTIEIELEKVFKKLLLYTKKRYAALVYDKELSYIETKGIDLVRRDFCQASTDLSRTVLNIILRDIESERSENLLGVNNERNDTKETTEKIYSACIDFYSTLFKRPVEDFLISSILSKDPQSYANGTNLPHVNLALRLNKKGLIYTQDDVVSYFIGEGDGLVSTRAHHPDEDYKIDYLYYIKNQILPPLFRLVSLLSYMHTEKIGLIFNVKDFAPKTTQSTLTFILPCCESVQIPSIKCAKCNKEVATHFYVEKVSTLLQQAASRMYNERGECLECGHVFLNHLTRCFYCQKDLKFTLRSQEFNNLLSSIENSFKDLHIAELDMLVANYSEVSSYRTIDMSKYFLISKAR